jgi:hypothetical protein
LMTIVKLCCKIKKTLVFTRPHSNPNIFSGTLY